MRAVSDDRRTIENQGRSFVANRQKIEPKRIIRAKRTERGKFTIFKG